MREAKRLQAEANAKYAEAEAVLGRFGLADVPPQPTPPQKGAEATPAGEFGLSAYQSNVKVEPPCVAVGSNAGSDRVQLHHIRNAGRCPSTPLVGVSAPVPTGTGSLLTREGTMFGNEQPKVARDMLVQGAALLVSGLLT